MPKVPNTDQLGNVSAEGARGNITIPGNRGVGGSEIREPQGLKNVREELLREEAEAQTRADNIASLEAVNNYRRNSHGFLYNTNNGAYTVQGKEALGLRAKHDDFHTQQLETINKSLGTPEARLRAKQRADELYFRNDIKLAKYSTVQNAEHEVGVINQSIDLEVEGIGQEYSSYNLKEFNDNYLIELEKVHGLTESRADISRIKDRLKIEYIQSAVRGALSARDYEAVDNILNSKDGEVSITTKYKELQRFKEQIQEAKDIKEGSDLAKTLHDSGYGVTELEQVLENKSENLVKSARKVFKEEQAIDKIKQEREYIRLLEQLEKQVKEGVDIREEYTSDFSLLTRKDQKMFEDKIKIVKGATENDKEEARYNSFFELTPEQVLDLNPTELRLGYLDYLDSKKKNIVRRYIEDVRDGIGDSSGDVASMGDINGKLIRSLKDKGVYATLREQKRDYELNKAKGLVFNEVNKFEEKNKRKITKQESDKIIEDVVKDYEGRGLRLKKSGFFGTNATAVRSKLLAEVNAGSIDYGDYYKNLPREARELYKEIAEDYKNFYPNSPLSKRDYIAFEYITNGLGLQDTAEKKRALDNYLRRKE